HENARMGASSRRPTARCPQHQAALANSPQDRSTDHEGLLMIGANRMTATGDSGRPGIGSRLACEDLLLAGRMFIMPKAFPIEFRRDVVAVARKGEAPLSQ